MNLHPLKNEGWSIGPNPDQRFGEGWTAERPGSVLEFEVEGTAIHLLYWVIKGGQGMAEVRIDEQPPVRLNGWFDQTWGGYGALQWLAEGLAPGRHKLRLELLEEKSPPSPGHRFTVEAVMAAGVTPGTEQ
jgi:hypothetical protein